MWVSKPLLNFVYICYGLDSSEVDKESSVLSIEPASSLGSHPFVALLKAFWPFGEDFKTLGIVGKIYEIIKVCLHTHVNVLLCVNHFHACN